MRSLATPRGIVAVATAIALAACAAPTTAPETPRPSATAPESDAPAAREQAEKAPEPAPAEPLPICDDPRLTALLAELEAGERSLAESERSAPLRASDLERVSVSPESFGEAASGPGVFGDLDADGDGQSDLLLHYASVDYWAWLVFVRAGDCLRYVDRIEAYQLEFMPSAHHGMRDVRLLTYPLQGRIESLRFDGSRWVR